MLIDVVRTRIHAATAEAQVVRAVGIVRSRRPIATVVTTIARRRTAPVAGIDEVIWEGTRKKIQGEKMQ